MVAVARDPGEVAADLPGGHVQRLQRQDAGLQRGSDVPADDLAGEDVGNERGIGEPRDNLQRPCRKLLADVTYTKNLTDPLEYSGVDTGSPLDVPASSAGDV